MLALFWKYWYLISVETLMFFANILTKNVQSSTWRMKTWENYMYSVSALKRYRYRCYRSRARHKFIKIKLQNQTYFKLITLISTFYFLSFWVSWNRMICERVIYNFWDETARQMVSPSVDMFSVEQILCWKTGRQGFHTTKIPRFVVNVLRIITVGWFYQEEILFWKQNFLD